MTAFDRLHIDLTVPPTYYEDEDQLDIGSERAFLELQDSEYIKDLGARALIAAQGGDARLGDTGSHAA